MRFTSNVKFWKSRFCLKKFYSFYQHKYDAEQSRAPHQRKINHKKRERRAAAVSIAVSKCIVKSYRNNIILKNFANNFHLPFAGAFIINGRRKISYKITTAKLLQCSLLFSVFSLSKAMYMRLGLSMNSASKINTISNNGVGFIFILFQLSLSFIY